MEWKEVSNTYIFMPSFFSVFRASMGGPGPTEMIRKI